MSTSLILTVYNGESLIDGCIATVVNQTVLPDELIVVDDGSSDNSYHKLKKLKKNLPFLTTIIRHSVNKGLSSSYNTGITYAKGDIIITLHQDARIQENTAFEQLLSVFKDPSVAAAGHKERIDRLLWLQYPFWLKLATARQLGKIGYGINGKCDAFRKNALIAAGLFDAKIFRTAGEDGDMVYKLRQIGTVVKTDVEIIHLHNHNFGFRDLIYKHAQLAEAQGVHLRRAHIHSFTELIRVTFREIILLFTIIPGTRYLGIILILAYSFLYTEKLYQQKKQDIRILIVPFVNIYLLFVDAFYMIRGFIRGKQTL